LSRVQEEEEEIKLVLANFVETVSSSVEMILLQYNLFEKPFEQDFKRIVGMFTVFVMLPLIILLICSAAIGIFMKFCSKGLNS